MTARAMSVPMMLRRIRGCDAPRRSARLEDERVERPEPEHHERVAEQAVEEPPAPRHRRVLRDRQRVHVAGPAPVEVPGGAVVDGVVVAPAVEGLEDDDPERDAEPRVGPPRRHEGAVRAVVEEDERAQQERGGRDRERQRQQIGHVEAEVHQRRQREVGHHRGGDVEERPPEVRLGVGRERLGARYSLLAGHGSALLVAPAGRGRTGSSRPCGTATSQGTTGSAAAVKRSAPPRHSRAPSPRPRSAG